MPSAILLHAFIDSTSVAIVLGGATRANPAAVDAEGWAETDAHDRPFV